MCGEGPKAGSKSSTKCTMKCKGNSAEICGGNDAIGIFKVDCSGAPVPGPPTPPPTPPPSPFVPPCDKEPFKSSAVWCDTSKDIDTRVASLVANLTTSEKASIFTNDASSIPRINWPNYNWWSEALHGVARDGLATSFPQICGVGTSLNKTLFKAMGEVVSTEARGKNNDRSNGDIYHGLTLWAPNVNIFRGTVCSLRALCVCATSYRRQCT